MRTEFPKRMFNARRWLVVGTIALVAFSTLLIVFLRVQFHGRALARTVQNVLNDTIRGKVEVESIDWAMSDLPKLATGGWVTVTIHNLKVWDDGGSKHEINEDNRQLVLRIEKLTCKLAAHSLLFGDHDIVIKDVVIEGDSYALIKQVAEPYPLHEYDYTVPSILSAFYPRLEPGFRVGLAAESAPIVDIRDFTVTNASIEFLFPGLRLQTFEVSSRGFLYADMSDPLSKKMYFALHEPRAERGTLWVGDIAEKWGRPEVAAREIATVYKIPLEDIELARFRQLPFKWPRDAIAHDIEIAATAQAEGATLSLSGGLRDYWVGYYGGDYDFDIAIDDAGPLARLLSEGLAGGDDLTLHARAEGSNLAPRFATDISGLELAIPIGKADDGGDETLDLALDNAHAEWDMATEQGSLANTVARGAGGKVLLAAEFGLSPLRFGLDVDIEEPIELSPYLPRDVVELVGGELGGQFTMRGDAKTQHLDELRLQLGIARISGELARDKSGVIATEWRDEAGLHRRELEIKLGATTVRTRGRVDMDNERLALDVTVDSRDLSRWLRAAGAPAIAGGASATAQVRGTLTSPRATASVQLRDVPVVHQASADVVYDDRVIDIQRAQTTGLGGSINGSARIRMGRRTEIVHAEATARQIDLARLPLPSGLLSGRADADLSAHGQLERLQIGLTTDFQDLKIAGDSYRDVVLAASTDRTGAGSLTLALPREDGGKIAVDVSRTADDQLHGRVTIDAVKLQNLAALDALGEPGQKLFGGAIATVLELSGTMDAPTVSGEIRWDGAWYDTTHLGPAKWRLSRAGEGLIAFEGVMLQSTLRMSGTLSTRAPYDVVIKVQMHRVDLDRFAPASLQQLSRDLGIRGWVTGEIAASMSLAPDAEAPPQVDARLTEVEFVIANHDANGRPAPIRVRNNRDTPMAIHYDGKRAALVSPVTIEGPGGDEFALAGSASPQELAVTLAGDIRMELFTPYLRDLFDDVSGTLRVALNLGGTPSAPEVKLGVEVVEAVSVRPIGQDAIVSLAANGRIDVSNSFIAPNNLQIRTVDQTTGETAVLDIRGTVGLVDFVPASWGLFIDGELAGKMLLVAAPRLFSQASGRAVLSVALQTLGDARGDGSAITWPQINGSIDFTPELDESGALIPPLSLTPRGLRRELVFTGGEVQFSTDLIELVKVSGSIDQEGEITNLSGEVSIDNWEPTSADVTLSATNLPFRIPQTLDLTLNVERLQIVGSGITSRNGQLEVAGTIEVVDGRYIENFNLIRGLIRPARRTGETSTPFYESVPILADARLDLRLNTRAFFVQNNIASVQLVGDVDITGTPRDPRIGGTIQVEHGEFKLPGIRARFRRTDGSVTFSELSTFPDKTPTLDVRSESDYRDPSGQEHLVTLTLRGPLDGLVFDLFTSSGLNKAQTLTLLLSGRTPDELRASLGDQAPGREPGRVARSTDPSEGYADEWLKQIAGDFIALLLDDKLRNLTGLDVARIEIATGSIGFHGEKELFKNLRFLGDLEQTLRGRTYDVRGELRLSDDVSIEGEYLNKDFLDDAEEDKTDARLRMVYRYLIP